MSFFNSFKIAKYLIVSSPVKASSVICVPIFFVASKIADDRVEDVLTDVYREMFVVDSLIMDLKLTIDSLEVKK